MIQKIYYGNVERLGTGTIPSDNIDKSIVVEAKKKGVYVSTFDVDSILSGVYVDNFPIDGGVIKKVDLLFYNRVNTLGKVLSTIVYVGEVRDATDTSDIPYFPETMYRNSLVELDMDLDCVEDFSYFNWIRWPGTPESYFVKQDEERLEVTGMPANIINRDTPVLDGWYTLVSAGVYVNPVGDGTDWTGNHTGSFAQRDGSELIEFSLVQEPSLTEDTDWHDYTVVDNTIVLMGHFVDHLYAPNNCSLDPPFIRQDFFVMMNYDREYARYLEKYAKDPGSLNDPFPSLRAKQRVIDRALIDYNFKEAQLYLQSTDFLRTKENII